MLPSTRAPFIFRTDKINIINVLVVKVGLMAKRGSSGRLPEKRVQSLFAYKILDTYVTPFATMTDSKAADLIPRGPGRCTTCKPTPPAGRRITRRSTDGQLLHHQAS
jgi:hypothetical protein